MKETFIVSLVVFAIIAIYKMVDYYTGDAVKKAQLEVLGL
jgi:hypothetical protein